MAELGRGPAASDRVGGSPRQTTTLGRAHSGRYSDPNPSLTGPDPFRCPDEALESGPGGASIGKSLTLSPPRAQNSRFVSL